MNRQTLRNRIVANVRNINAVVKAPATPDPKPAARTVVLFGV